MGLTGSPISSSGLEATNDTICIRRIHVSTCLTIKFNHTSRVPKSETGSKPSPVSEAFRLYRMPDYSDRIAEQGYMVFMNAEGADDNKSSRGFPPFLS